MLAEDKQSLQPKDELEAKAKLNARYTCTAELEEDEIKKSMESQRRKLAEMPMSRTSRLRNVGTSREVEWVETHA